MLPNSHRIPLEVAHRFLGIFGFTKSTREYERWVKDDGFDFADFPGVLNESPFIFGIDWRAALPDELERISEALVKLEIELEVDIDPSADFGTVAYGGKQAPVKYVPNDGDDFTSVIAAIQSVMPPEIEFRASPFNGDSDGWDFAVLPRDEWALLEALDAELVNSMFVPMERRHS